MKHEARGWEDGQGSAVVDELFVGVGNRHFLPGRFEVTLLRDGALEMRWIRESHSAERAMRIPAECAGSLIDRICDAIDHPLALSKGAVIPDEPVYRIRLRTGAELVEELWLPRSTVRHMARLRSALRELERIIQASLPGGTPSQERARESKAILPGQSS